MRYSPPSTPLFRWLLGSSGVDDPEVAQSLLATLFSRIAADAMAATCELIVITTALVTHPGGPFGLWLMSSASVLTARTAVLLWSRRQAARERPTPTALAACLSVGAVASLGFGDILCNRSGDAALQLLVTACLATILTAVVARNAGAPRLAIVQVLTGLGCMTAGAFLAPQPWMRVMCLQTPLGALGLASLCRKTNSEIVGLLKARRDNATLARQDPLTGLPNRMLVAETLETLIAHPCEGARFALISMDLDGFKAVNDSLGHAAGDAVLIEVARRLRRICIDPLLVSRLGGDEFLVALRERHTGDAEALARKIGGAIRAPFSVPGAPDVRIGSSFGVARFPDDGVDADAVMIAADKALYGVKRSGKGDVAAYDRARHVGEADLFLLRSEMEAALQNDPAQFVIHYQPILAASGDAMITAREALVRWRHPSQGLISPIEFIPMAEATELIVPLGEIVLRRACADAAGWAQPSGVAVNVSPVQLREGRLAAIVASALADAALPADRLEIEITETALLSDDATTHRTMLALRELGVRLVLDDFGTGFSSLANLCRFTFDRIKIDGSFVREALRRHESAAVVRATVALARELGVPTTAECIETADQLAFIGACGCDDVQGFLLGRPVENAQIDQAAHAVRTAA